MKGRTRQIVIAVGGVFALWFFGATLDISHQIVTPRERLSFGVEGPAVIRQTFESPYPRLSALSLADGNIAVGEWQLQQDGRTVAFLKPVDAEGRWYLPPEPLPDVGYTLRIDIDRQTSLALPVERGSRYPLGQLRVNGDVAEVDLLLRSRHEVSPYEYVRWTFANALRFQNWPLNDPLFYLGILGGYLYLLRRFLKKASSWKPDYERQRHGLTDVE